MISKDKATTAIRRDDRYLTIEIDAADGYTYKLGIEDVPRGEREPGHSYPSPFQMIVIRDQRPTDSRLGKKARERSQP